MLGRVVIVIDASSLTKFLLKEERWDDVEPYLRINPVSVDYVFLEAANAIWKESVVRNRITGARALETLHDLKKMKDYVFETEPFTEHLDEGFTIAANEKISVYDAVYIDMSKKHDGLLTSDKGQRDAALRVGAKVIYVP